MTQREPDQPARTTPWRYDEFALRIYPERTGGGFTVLVQNALVGSGSGPLRLPVPASRLREQVELLLPERARRRRHAADPLPELASPEAVGRALYDALFHGRIRDAFRESLARVRVEGRHGLRLRLYFDLQDAQERAGPEERSPADEARRTTELAAVAALPWELLYDAERRDFLARELATPVVRFLDVPRATLGPPVSPPLGLLVVHSEPLGHGPAGLPGELRQLEKIWGERARVRVLPDPGGGLDASIESVRRLLRDEEIHVLHFIGHGDVDPETGEGRLLFSTGERRAQKVPARVLGETLSGIDSLRLVVANACLTGEVPARERIDPFGSIATSLVWKGVPAVVGMQWPITGAAALAFSKTFYRSLAARRGLEEAMAEARQAIYLDAALEPADLPFEWATPALYLRASEGRILEELVAESDGVAPAIRQQVRNVSPLIDDATRGFVGREFLFEAMRETLGKGRDRERGGYFTLVGEPGIGKTAFAAELVRRHGWVHHFNVRAQGAYRPEAFLRNVCAQLVVRFRLPYRALPSDPHLDGQFLSRLLGEIAPGLDPEEPLVLVVDALDESDTDGLPAGVNPLFLPPRLPGNVFGVLTSRPFRDFQAPSFDAPERRLLLDPDSRDNRADLRALVESRLGTGGLRGYLARHDLSDAELVDTLDEKSAGNFMYLHHVLAEIEEGVYDDVRLDSLPRGLTRYYESHWKRMRGRDDHATWLDKLSVLGALTVIHEPATVRYLTDLSTLDDPRVVRQVLQEWRPFLRVTQGEEREGRPRTTFSIYHATFHEFLCGKEEVAAEHETITGEERERIAGAGGRQVAVLLEALEEDQPG